MNANQISNEWPEEYGLDLSPAMAAVSLWELPALKLFMQMAMVAAVLLLAAAEANALGNGQTSMLGMGWWEGLFDINSAGAYDAGGAAAVAY